MNRQSRERPSRQEPDARRFVDRLANEIPYLQFLGIGFDCHGDELTAVLPFDWKHVGNPDPAALHGGATAAFMEVTALAELCWKAGIGTCEDEPDRLVRMPKTISFSIEYLRPGLCTETFARARVNRAGRRYASVNVECWQETRSRLISQATGHFLMPDLRSGSP